MSRREAIPESIQTKVLVQCRRRCCLCVYLNHDRDVKQGQLAHIDQDASNASIDNLVFLCLPHHDTYDSVTRQSKNITSRELREYRNRLSAEWGEVVDWYSVLGSLLDPQASLSSILHRIIELAAHDHIPEIEAIARSYVKGVDGQDYSGIENVNDLPPHVRIRAIEFHFGIKKQINLEALRFGAISPSHALHAMKNDRDGFYPMAVVMPSSILEIEQKAENASSDGLLTIQRPLSDFLLRRVAGDDRQVTGLADGMSFVNILSSIRTDLIRRIEPLCK